MHQMSQDDSLRFTLFQSQRATYMCFRDISYRESIAWWQHMNWVICPTQLVMQQEHKLYGSSSTGSPADKKILHPSRR